MMFQILPGQKTNKLRYCQMTLKMVMCYPEIARIIYRENQIYECNQRQYNDRNELNKKNALFRARDITSIIRLNRLAKTMLPINGFEKTGNKTVSESATIFITGRSPIIPPTKKE